MLFSGLSYSLLQRRLFSSSAQLLIHPFTGRDTTAEDEKSACECVNHGVIDAAITKKG